MVIKEKCIKLSLDDLDNICLRSNEQVHNKTCILDITLSEGQVDLKPYIKGYLF